MYASIALAVGLVLAFAWWRRRSAPIFPPLSLTTVLIVIDMQRSFLWDLKAPGHRLVANVGKQIDLAMARGVPIIFVEYGDTPIDGRLIARLAGYPKVRWQRVRKDDLDGSDAVLSVCKHFGYAVQTLRLCGTYAEACVWHTAIGLQRQLPNSRIEVVKEATFNSLPFGWMRYSGTPIAIVDADWPCEAARSEEN